MVSYYTLRIFHETVKSTVAMNVFSNTGYQTKEYRSCSLSNVDHAINCEPGMTGTAIYLLEPLHSYFRYKVSFFRLS